MTEREVNQILSRNKRLRRVPWSKVQLIEGYAKLRGLKHVSRSMLTDVLKQRRTSAPLMQYLEDVLLKRRRAA